MLREINTCLLNFSKKKIPYSHIDRMMEKIVIFSLSLFQGDSPFGKSEAYIKLEQLGEGSYATVYKGFSK